MIAAFYWLPALLEADAIKLSLISEQLSHIEVKRHLRPLAEILALPHTADPTQQNQAIPISLGWPQLIVSAIGLLLSWRLALRRYLPLMLLIWIISAVPGLHEHATFRAIMGRDPADWIYAISLAIVGLGEPSASAGIGHRRGPDRRHFARG